jgi:photosystem II stability/assembly factor-like uncharacterized protein
MRNFLFVIISILCFSLVASSQIMYRPSATEIKTLPAWAQEMYSENPNVFKVDVLYKDYYRTHEFEKTYHTQYYVRWRRAVESRLDENGYVIPVKAEDEIKSDLEYRNKLANKSHQKSLTEWSPVGPYQVYDNSNQPANDQTNVYSIDQCAASPNVMYCGTEPGEVYKSVDGAATWKCISLSENFGGVTAVEVDPTNANIVFAGSGSTVRRSTNGGVTWATVLTATNLNPNEILVNSANTQIVLVAGDAGLYRSTNGGSTYTQLYSQKCFDVKQKPGTPTTVYLVKDNPSTNNCEFFRSTNSGQTWTQQSSGWYTSSDPACNDGGARIGVTPADPNRVYAYLIGEAKANDYGFIGVYKSTDGGTTWTLPNPPPGGPYTTSHLNLAYGTPSWTYHQGFYNCAIMVSSTDANKILVGGLNIYRSNDGALTFSPVSGYIGGGNLSIHVDVQDFRVVGTNYWITTDGGVYTSPDFFATTQTRKNAGIRGSDYWGFGSGWNEDVLVGGLYHNGNIAYYEDYGAGNFLSLGGGEASTGYVNPGNNHKTYFSDIGGRYLPEVITDPVGGFSMGMSPNESYYAGESSEIEFYPSCYNIAFLGNENKLWKTTDGGASYNLIKTFGSSANDQVKYIEVSRSNPQVMYVNQQPQSGSTGTLWKTTDGGTTWNSIPIPTGNSRVMLLALDYTNANILWIAYTYGGNGQKIFKTTNGGSTWTNLTTATLNNENAHSIAAITNTNGGIYYCSGRTVFYRNNTLSDWQIVNDSLPAYFNSDIAHPFYRDGKLRIASYGKGIWESSLYDQPTAPAAQITVDKLDQTVVCVADSFYFDDYSTLNHAGASWAWTFQNGSPATSSLRNPHVFYSAPGTYLATLTVTDGSGHSSSDSLYVTVNAYVPPTAVQEGFQASFPPAEIMIVNPENDAQWSLNSATGGFGNSSQCAIFDNFDNDSHGKWDDMQVSINFSNPASNDLTFDVAHACYGGQYTDTLEVLASTDCGSTFTLLYKKWGNTLATAPNNSNYYTPSASEWRTDTVDLAAYAGTAHLLVAFRNIGLWGNNIYIDNINMQSLITNVSTMKQDHFEVYPNPVKHDGALTVTDPLNEKIKVTMMDGNGRVVLRQEIQSSSRIDLSPYNLAAGVYHLNLAGETKIMNYKIVVQ